MGRIVLDSDIQVKPPIVTNEVRDYLITIEPDNIKVRLDWMHQEYDEQDPPQPVGDPVLVKTEHYIISGPPFDELMTATVAEAHVGKNFWTLMRRGIRNKVKELKALQGTVE